MFILIYHIQCGKMKELIIEEPWQIFTLSHGSFICGKVTSRYFPLFLSRVSSYNSVYIWNSKETTHTAHVGFVRHRARAIQLTFISPLSDVSKYAIFIGFAIQRLEKSLSYDRLSPLATPSIPSLSIVALAPVRSWFWCHFDAVGQCGRQIL